MSEKNNSPLLSSLLEIGPVIIFFAVFIWRKGEVMVIGGVEYSSLIQATAILTFLVSTYIVIFNFPTPIAISDRLRRD